MKCQISTEAQKHAAEVASLLHAYSSAGSSPEQMLHSTTVGFDMADIRRYAETDQMPVRISGKLYPVSEQAASCIAITSGIMRQMAEDGVSDPAGSCARTLDYMLSGLERRRTISIALIDAQRGQLSVTMPGAGGEVCHIDPIMVACFALEITDFDVNALNHDRADLAPV